MSFMRGSAGGATNVKPDYTGLQIQTSVSTLPIPIVYGTAKLAPNIIWYADFTAKGQNASAGGKGGGSEPTSYTYFASLILGLCEGPIAGIGQIWKGTDLYTLASLGFTLFDGTTPQGVWSYLASRHGAQALAYQGTALLAEANYALGDTPDLDNHNIEIYGPFRGTGANAEDADPALCIQDFLTNGQYGVGLPAAAIDTATLLSSAAAATTGDAALQTYCKALGICFSSCLATQETAQTVLQRWLQLTNSAAIWSGTTLKFIPYGDLPVTGNGVTYQPDVTPRYDLDDDDFQGDASDDPVEVQRIDVADAYNVQRIEVADRTNAYNYTPIEARDESMVNLYGLRVASTVTAHEICDTTIAATVGQLILQRGLYIRNTYSFKLSWEYCLLEPMDLVTLTDAGLGLAKTPVRITSIEEDENGYLTVTAEEFPAGIATATQYPKQAGAAGALNYNVAADPVNPPVIFEPSASLTGGVAQVWIAASGGSGGAADANWGGAYVWLSPDGTTYQQIGQITAPARQGYLTAALPAPSASPDTTSILAVDLSESGGVLANATEADAAAARTLCWADGELIAYASAALTATSHYNLAYLARGLYDTTASAHQAGAQFVRLDNAVFKYDLPAAYVGQEIYLKLQSYNIWGAGIEDISTVEAYPLTPAGTGYYVAPPSAVVISSNAATQSDGSHILSLVISWAASAGPLLDHYEVQYQTQGASSWLGVTVGGDQTDFVLVGAAANVTYGARVRAISTVGNASAWAVATDQSSGALSTTLPSTPTGLAAAGGQGAIVLTWNANPETDIRYYRVLAVHGYATDETQASTVALVSGTSYDLINLGYGDTWTFWLEAVNVAGSSNPAGPAHATSALAIDIDGILDGSVTLNKLTSDVASAIAAITAPTATAGSLAGQLAALVATINQQIAGAAAMTRVLVNELSTQSQSLDGVTQTVTTQSETVASLSESLGVVTGQVNSLDTTTASLSSSLAGVSTTVASQGTSFTNSINTLTGDIAAQGVEINTLTASVTTLNGAAAVTGSVAQQISVSASVLNGEITAVAGSVTALTATVNTNNTTTTAAITTEATARANGDAANASAINTLTATVNGNYAAYQSSITAQATTNSATASAISTLESSVGGNTAAIQTAATTLNGVTAEYTVKTEVDSNGTRYIGGLGLLATPDGSGGIAVDATFLCTEFAIAQLNSNGTVAKQYPFVVQNGNVYINSALINTLAANQITSGTITTAAIAIEPAAGSGGGLTVYNQAGTKILDSVTGLWPDSGTKFYSASNGSVTSLSSTSAVATLINTSFAIVGSKARFEVFFQTSPAYASTDGGSSLMFVSTTLSINGTVVLTVITAAGALVFFPYSITSGAGSYAVQVKASAYVPSAVSVGATPTAVPVGACTVDVIDFKA